MPLRFTVVRNMKKSHLKWKDPLGREHVCVLGRAEYLLGRKSEADIVLSEPSVSRHHARLLRNENGYTIMDLQTTYGTFVNGERIHQKKLNHGDSLKLGHCELTYTEGEVDAHFRSSVTAIEDLEKSMVRLASILPASSSDRSELEKISSILDFQYQVGKIFSAELTFQQILNSALSISGAERGFILLKQENRFEFVTGMDQQGRILPESEFQTSQSVVTKATREGKPILMTEHIANEFSSQASIVGLRLRSLACMPLRWLSPENEAVEIRGVLYLDSTKRMHTLSGLDEKILNKLAQDAGNVFEKLQTMQSYQDRRSMALELSLAEETKRHLEQELRSAEELRRAEAQVLMAEFAGSMGKFAAALSHELNTPIGVLKSSLESFRTLGTKRATFPPEKQAAMEDIDNQLRQTAYESVERLYQIVQRMQRFTNLDRNEALAVDLNLLLQDVIDILRSDIPKNINLEISFQPLPLLNARPQQLSAVFSNLLHNALQNVRSGGRVSLQTESMQAKIRVTIQDDGEGLSSDELEGIFDPAFKVKSGRVATSNWSLFSSRQIVREHGGEIELESSSTRGTCVRVTLPTTMIREPG